MWRCRGNRRRRELTLEGAVAVYFMCGRVSRVCRRGRSAALRYLAMINPSAIHGRRIAMIAWAKTSDGEDDVAVFSGIAEWRGTSITLLREPPESSFVLRDEWLARLKPVPDELKATLLDAEYQFSVRVGDLTEADDRETLLKTGLKWPNGEKAG